MSSTRPADDINYWINIGAKLTPNQNFALLGAIIENRLTTLDLDNPDSVITEGNCSAAEKWASQRVRKMLRLYCSRYTAFHVLALAELIKAFAPILQVEMNMLVGPSVSFIFWAAGYGLDKWCQKYKAREFEGRGAYSVLALETAPGRDYNAFFKVTYTPAIVEIVRFEESVFLDVKQRRVVAPAETEGFMEFESSDAAAGIYRTFSPRVDHAFTFEDTHTRSHVGGRVGNVFTARFEGPKVLELKAGELTIAAAG